MHQSTHNQPPSYLYVHALLLLMTVLVAGSFPVGGEMMQSLNQTDPSLNSGQLMLLRFALASLLFAPYIVHRFGLTWPGFERLRVYTALALPLAVFFCCMFASLETSSVLNSGALFTSVPALAAIYARLLNGERSGPLLILGLVLGTAGALWVVFRGDLAALAQLQFSQGDAIFMIGCLFLGAYQPLVKRWHREEPVAVMTFWVILMATLLLLMFSLVSQLSMEPNPSTTAQRWRQWHQLPASVYWGLAYLALFTTLLSFFLQQLGAITLGPARTSAYSLLTPVFVMAMSFYLEPQLFDWVLLPGVILVIVGVVLIQLGRTRDA
ncbi:DMT family transporter [Aestuariirhabdus sp. Z084]|uniref:DMT family transporter n=1 Tax=Aestuariirhabdus haliotis TaxID=2918751 RepID=UPI00201B3F84|nr:DMT family transporter [Aestuariirhabdus haliotis]MCL6415272.1 DMT family transporter [Aestuariirhabdus haliotis]MCL6419532.1 DMT family transporter [Aestuariirhabdus haliotis]